ncbi:MAG: AAA family ATPase [Paludibacteraceae bacterium]
MYQRILHLHDYVEEMSIFLFSARQTGKSTILRKQFPSAIYIDLLDSELYARYSRNPALIYEYYHTQPAETLIIIDEIQLY